MTFNQGISGTSNDDFVQCSIRAIFRLSIESPLFCQPRAFLFLVSCKNFNVILGKPGGGGGEGKLNYRISLQIFGREI